MENLQITYYLIAIAFIWLTILSGYFLKILGSWNKLTRSGKDLNLAEIFENIVKRQGIVDNKVEEALREISKLESSGRAYFQKYALVRFNPFEETGGDQSFIIAILNGQNSGFVISSLHSRNGTRVYAKQVQDEKPVGHQFSKEEQEVVGKAARLGEATKNKIQNVK